MSDESEQVPDTSSSPLPLKGDPAEYTSKDLEHLSDLEHVRERPGISGPHELEVAAWRLGAGEIGKPVRAEHVPLE